ncbi:MAG: methylisocitrate lyase [Chloroflexi bacterium]|jgi:2-methylisocitrate lyase-like PEP mutase family enzyme|nr:MAG: methylisocitrate lyase [Chloroflexota bacterium]
MEQIASDVLAAANLKSRRLKDLLGQPETLVMPGAYDGLSARLFESMGFRAIQCASGGIAASLGYLDGEVVTREQTLRVSQIIAEAVSVPVNGDGERGYGEAHEVGETVRGYILAGCAGMNIEDSKPHSPGAPMLLVPVAEHLEKLEAIMATKRELGSEFFVNARVDSFLAFRDNSDAALEEGISRGKMYAAAGADCIFFIGVTSPEAIALLVRDIPAPVSVLAGPEAPPLSVLQELGVARVSYGTAFARAAGGAIRRLAEEIRDAGTITRAQDGITGPEMAQLMLRSSDG